MKWYLDFGHGGKDSGAVSANKTKESDTVLKIGMLIKNNLEKAVFFPWKFPHPYWNIKHLGDLEYFMQKHIN